MDKPHGRSAYFWYLDLCWCCGYDGDILRVLWYSKGSRVGCCWRHRSFSHGNESWHLWRHLSLPYVSWCRWRQISLLLLLRSYCSMVSCKYEISPSYLQTGKNWTKIRIYESIQGLNNRRSWRPPRISHMTLVLVFSYKHPTFLVILALDTNS